LTFSIDWAAKREELARESIGEAVLFLQDLLPAGVYNNLNVCNHRKFMVIDGNASVIGSLNIGDRYLYDTPLTDAESAESGVYGLGIPAPS
jgi:cardiolipin synthase